jgi:hypothetical protein
MKPRHAGVFCCLCWADNGAAALKSSHQCLPVIRPSITNRERPAGSVRQGDVLKADSRYLFDKLLHNDYALKSGWLPCGQTLVSV